MKLKIVLPVLFCIISLPLQVLPGRAETPTARVRSMLEEVMILQTDPRLQGPEFRNQRRAAIKKIISQNFEFNTMARHALGAYWDKLDEAERGEFKTLFQVLFQDSYTKMVLDFLKQEKILYLQEEIHQNQALVKTRIVRVNEEIPVDYSLTLVQGKWTVEDIIIDGVSIVRNYQRSFSQVIQRDSFKSLLQKMRLQQQAIEKTSS
jgi:phospholipid transport system substrate-binding protein